MKRTLIFITLLVLLLCGGVARGQEDTNACAKPKACYHTMSVYVSMGPGDILLSLVQFGYDGKLRFGHYDVGFLYNFHFNSHWSLGVGTEFHSSNGLWTIGGFPSLFFNNNFNLYHKDLYTLPVHPIRSINHLHLFHLLYPMHPSPHVPLSPHAPFPRFFVFLRPNQ